MGIKNFFQGLRDRVDDMVEQNKEKKEFLNLVDKETKPIRRSAYLKEKMMQAVVEGRMIAMKEFDKNKEKLEQKKTKEDFNLDTNIINSKQDFSIQDPFKYMRPQEEEIKTKKSKSCKEEKK